MSVLSGLKPERVFYYFEEICKIPRGSFHTEKISSYLVEFAKVHGLEYRQDESGNVVIKKTASKGYEDAPAVILQGHCDMVCEKKPGYAHDFEKDGLELAVEGDLLSARGTTLGGDDGIAVAYALAVLEDDSLKHPSLEVVITTDEEVGMLGAMALDTSDLKGTYMLNIDSEEEGKLWISCAGGLSAVCEIPVEYRETQGVRYEVMIEGLAGGQKDNAIPRSARAVFLADACAEKEIAEAAAEFGKNLRAEYSGTDDGISVNVRTEGETEGSALTMSAQQKVLFFLMQFPYGVQKMSGEIAGLVETSVNPGILCMDGNACRMTASLRSSVGSAKKALSMQIQYLTEFLGGSYTPEGAYPAWEYRKDSALREIMADTYEDMFGERPEIKAIHAGLECGIFYEKIPNLDCVSFGPSMSGIHTTEETLSISSTERMWKYLLKVLENIR